MLPARGSCSPKPATRTASIRRPTRASSSASTPRDHGVASLPLEFLAARLAADRPRHRDQRHHLQSIPGQGPPRRLPDLHLGLGRRLPRSGEFLLPARVSERALQERRAQYGRFLRRGVRPALPRDEVPAQRRAARRSHPAHGGDPGAGAPLDRALPPRALHAEPRLAGQLQAMGISLSGLQVQGCQTRRCAHSCGPNGTRRCAGRSISC